MKLSLSTRIAEAPAPHKDRALMPLTELALVAKSAGYRALCMRASQVSVQSSAAQLRHARSIVDDAGLGVSMVSGNNDVPVNNDRVGMVLREIGKHLDVAQALGADLIRIGMKAHTDVPWAQRACDEAAERGIRLAHQCHACTLFETVDKSLEVVRAVDRTNFGIIYEPSSLRVCGQDYGAKTIRALAPHIMNVYLQNWWIRPNGTSMSDTWINGPVKYDLVPFGDPRGVDFATIFNALGEIGYDGYVTVHQVGTGIDIATGAREFADYLRSVAAFS